MEGVTEESRGPSDRGQDEITPALFDGMLPTGKDAAVPTVMDPGEDNTEPPPDWLEPLEDCDVEEDEEMKTGKRRGRRPKRTNNASRRRVKRNNWEDCPDLGKDWKRKLIMWRDGKSAAYYLSPTGLRFRSKVQLAKHLQADLTRFDYKQGKFVEGVISKRKRRKADVREDHIRSSLSSSRTATPDLDMTRTPENIPPTPQNGPRKHKRSKFVPFLQSNLTPNNLDISPVQLARISPNSQQPSPSPSLRLDLLSAQTTPLPPLAPVSPPKTPENNLIYLNGPTADLTNLRAPRINQLNLVHDGREQHHGLPPIEGCANCGRKYPGMGRGKQLLCPKCRPSRKQQPHIIFRKVGQDKWVLGKAKKEISLKKKMHALGKKSHPFKSRRLMAQQEKEEQKTLKKSDEEDNELGAGDTEDVGDVEDTGDIVDGDAGDIGSVGDDSYEYGPRKRKRRMCGRCRACLREHDCGKCDFCLDKTKFGGPNRLRQKCRYRQCQVRSRLQVGWSKYTKHPPIFLEPEQEEQKGRKRGRPMGKRRRKHRPWSGNTSADDEKNDNEMEEETWRPGRRGRRSRSRRRRFGRPRRPKDNMDDMADPEIEDGGSGDLEQTPYVVYDEVRSGFYESEEFYSNSYVQNGTEINLMRTSEPHAVIIHPGQFPPSQDLVYTVPALPLDPQPLASLMCNGSPFSLSHMPSPAPPLPLSHMQGIAAPLQMGHVPEKVFSPQVNELLTSNGASLRLSDFLRRNGLELVEVDTVYPQLFPPAHQEPEPAHQQPEPAHQEPEPDPLHEAEPDPRDEPESPTQPESLGSSPVIVQTSSLEDYPASSSTRDPGLLELLCSLRRTILPAHWVGVMTNGPVLQLFQCSKLSTMADTVLQIEQDFLFQISVQNQPLLPTHALYDRHPARLENVAKIVALLVDLEELNVCQGYQRFEANSQREPLLCARAALCQLLVPQNQDSCEKCRA